MAKKFEILEGTLRDVVKRLGGFEQVITIEDFAIYNEVEIPRAFVIYSTDGGYWPWPRRYDVKEYTLQEWTNIPDDYYGNYGEDEEGNTIYGGTQREDVSHVYYINQNKGVSVVSVEATIDIPIPGQGAWSLPTITITGTKGPSGEVTGTVKITGMDDWPADKIFSAGFDNGGSHLLTEEEREALNFTGTPAEIMAHDFPLPPESPFENYLNGGISGDGMRVNISDPWDYGEDIGSSPWTFQPSKSGGGVQLVNMYVDPPEGSGGGPK